MRLPRLTATLLHSLAFALATGTAVAAPDVKSRLTTYETEARALASNMPQPGQMSSQTSQRRLVDAQVAFSIGDYDQASLVLFDLVGQPTTTAGDREIAQFYLAESLHHKGDRGAARAYFHDLVKTSTTASRYHLPSLMRVVEIAIADNDITSGEQAVVALNNLSGGLKTAGVPYVQGKWAFHLSKYDDALGLFNSVPNGSEYELQAKYYSGTVFVAKRDLGKATEIFADLVTRHPKTNSDRRVIELAQLALGRIYYEREQASKSIDAYLLVDRRSDLFPTALYEVAWVYVKSKQYDKALTALELLGRLDPQSTKTPTVKILEGNLRIRKAQLIRQAEIAGTISTEERSTPLAEYGKAEKLFTDTHDAYLPSYLALTRMAEGQLDPATFIDQISGRNTRLFAAAAPIPEAAAQWLREEPEVQKVVAVETDLALVQRYLDESSATITRLEGVLATGDRLSLYPALSARRLRIAAIQHDLIGIRNDLAEQAIRGGGSSGATAQRKALAAQYATLGDAERMHGERTGAAHDAYDKVGDGAGEVEKAIMETQAMAVALRTYALSGQVPDDQRGTITSEIEAATKEARAIEDELAAVQNEIELGKDLAGVGDKELLAARGLRQQLIAAQNAEHQGFASQGRASTLGDQAARLAIQLEGIDAQIDQLIARGIEQIKSTLATERQNIGEYRQLLSEYEAEARTVGAEIIGLSFKAVKDRFYDVVIRTDVGNVDVSWSQKEDNDDDLKRLGLAKSRDLKQLRDEFRFILDDTSSTPAQPKAAPQPAPTEGGAGTSPDKGGGTDGRIRHAGEDKKATPAPTVKPDKDPASKTKTTPKTAPSSKSPATTPAKGGAK
jgi:tetratricopeptide (TPR) repeat protein